MSSARLRPLRSPFGVLVGLVLLVAACGPSAFPARAPLTCLTGPVPKVGRPAPDEMFELMRRELTRAERSPPLVRARMLERLHTLLPDVSDLSPEPPCHGELENEGIEAIRRDPLELSRLLVARVRQVHDARPLMELAARDPATMSEYRLSPGEPGPPPAKSFLRYLVLANIPAAWVANNVASDRLLLLDRIRVSHDALELLLLYSAARAVFDGALWGHPERAEGTEAPSLLASWLADLENRLRGAPHPASLELALLELTDVGTFAVRFGHEREARGLVNEILAAKGEMPLTRGVDGAARDLAEVARVALFDLDTPQKSLGRLTLPRPRRSHFDPRADWLDREPAGGRVTDADALARARDLDEELGRLVMSSTRCYAIEELGRWLPASEATSRFDALLAPVLGGGLRFSTETLCRQRVALGLEGADETRRLSLLAQLLSATPPKPGDRDDSRDEHGPGLARAADEDPVRQIGAKALAENLPWIDRHAALRAWLEENALAPIPLDSASAQTWSLLQPAFERTVAFHGSGAPGAKLETAQAILREWMTAIRTAEAAKDVSHIYVGEVVSARIRALGEYGKRAGLSAEISAFLDERKTNQAAVVAAFLLNL